MDYFKILVTLIAICTATINAKSVKKHIPQCGMDQYYNIGKEECDNCLSICDMRYSPSNLAGSVSAECKKKCKFYAKRLECEDGTTVYDSHIDKCESCGVYCIPARIADNTELCNSNTCILYMNNAKQDTSTARQTAAYIDIVNIMRRLSRKQRYEEGTDSYLKIMGETHDTYNKAMRNQLYPFKISKE